jgi:hypothetical protein
MWGNIVGTVCFMFDIKISDCLEIPTLLLSMQVSGNHRYTPKSVYVWVLKLINIGNKKT